MFEKIPQRSLLLATVLLVIGCGGGDRPLPPELLEDRDPELLVLVYDRSTSIMPHELEHYFELTRDRLRHLTHGDRIVALEIMQLSVTEEPRRWAQQVPVREFPDRIMQRDSVNRARFLQDARDYLRQYTDNENRDNYLGTDILSTLHLVAAELTARRDHRMTVVLFSDMLQANDLMNMEGLVRMPPAGWVQRQAELGTLPDLSGACIVVVGARVDTPASQRVRAFWTEYFEATGANFMGSNYQHRAVEIPERPCG